MSGPCAKQQVTATIVAKDGRRFVGFNDVRNPQRVCPRVTQGMPTGQGYHLCREICDQPAHAEANALLAAGDNARGAVLYVEGHSYACLKCQQLAKVSGIVQIVIGSPP